MCPWHRDDFFRSHVDFRPAGSSCMQRRRYRGGLTHPPPNGEAARRFHDADDPQGYETAAPGTMPDAKMVDR